jgi:hypothetical protein
MKIKVNLLREAGPGKSRGHRYPPARRITNHCVSVKKSLGQGAGVAQDGKWSSSQA